MTSGLPTDTQKYNFIDLEPNVTSGLLMDVPLKVTRGLLTVEYVLIYLLISIGH